MEESIMIRDGYGRLVVAASVSLALASVVSIGCTSQGETEESNDTPQVPAKSGVKPAAPSSEGRMQPKAKSGVPDNIVAPPINK